MLHATVNGASAVFSSRELTCPSAGSLSKYDIILYNNRTSYVHVPLQSTHFAYLLRLFSTQMHSFCFPSRVTQKRSFGAGYGRPIVQGRPLYFCPVVSFFLFSLPNLSGRRLDVYHTSTHGMALVRIQNAGLKCAACSSLQIQDTKKIPILAPLHKFVGLYLRN